MTIVSEFEAGATRLSYVDRYRWYSLPVWWVRADIKLDMLKFLCCQVLKFSLILKKRRKRCPGQLHCQSGGHSSCCCPAEESCAYLAFQDENVKDIFIIISKLAILFSFCYFSFAPSELLVVDQSRVAEVVQGHGGPRRKVWTRTKICRDLRTSFWDIWAKKCLFR